MPPRRDITLKQLDEAGHDVTAWCFACGRGKRFDTNIWQHFADQGWPMSMAAAARQFRCHLCRSSEHVSLFPSTRPYQPPTTGADLAAAIFFGARKAAKEARRDPITERAMAIIVKERTRAKPPKRPMPPPPTLHLVWSKPE